MIEIKNLSKTFKTADGSLDALKNVSLTINDGDIYGVIGMSGAGKSTLVRCINMLERPTEGQILIDGVDMGALSSKQLRDARRNITMIFQGFNLLMQRNCLKNICFPLELEGMKKEDAKKRALELLEIVGLPDKAKAYPAQLSGGQQQRIAIARTLAMDPDIILFDEPTSALDPSMIGEVQSVIKVLAKSGRTMMIVTHEMDFARKISNRVFFMCDGTIYEEGSPKEIFEHPKREATRKFIQRLSSLTYKIDSQDFDMEAISEELQKYGEKLLIEAERLTKLTLALEEICINNIAAENDNPDILVRVEYSEKLDVLTMRIKYKGADFDLKEAKSSKVFLSLLEEPTTTYSQVNLENDKEGYEHQIEMNFRWQEEQR